MTFAELIRNYADRAGMSPSAALSYRMGAMQARLLIATAASDALNTTPKEGK